MILRNSSSAISKPPRVSIADLLSRKNPKANPFRMGGMKFAASIDEHADWAYEHIYSVPYISDPSVHLDEESKSEDKSQHKKIARSRHGIHHTARAAMYVPALVNFYRRHANSAELKEELKQITNDKIKLLQIALLFHDAGREAEGEDKWDQDSALMLYHYLTHVLADPAKDGKGVVSAKDAKEIAEAIVNKDSHLHGHYELHDHGDGTFSWEKCAVTPEKTIYQKIIHDADCLDVIRVRPAFDAGHLDFYKDIAKDNSLAFAEMGKLIREVRGVVESQRDGFLYRDEVAKKRRYEKKGCYKAILETVIKESKKTEEKAESFFVDFREHYHVLPFLYADGKLLPEDKLKQDILPKPTEEKGSIKAAIRNASLKGELFARAIGGVSALGTKPLSVSLEVDADQEEKSEEKYETAAATEFRKASRTPGESAQTFKLDKYEKRGNEKRSFSVAGLGGRLYANSGGLKLKLATRHIHHISSTNAGTKRGGQKRILAALMPEEKERKLEELRRKQNMGGSFVKLGKEHGWTRDVYQYHTEIVCDVVAFEEKTYQKKDPWDALFFSLDPNFYNEYTYGTSMISHYHAPVLEAIFLQKEYEKTYGKKLQIFEYSGLHDYIVDRDYSDGETHDLWVEMASYFMQEKIATGQAQQLADLSVDDIKILSMYKTKVSKTFSCEFSSADSNYAPELRARITESIKAKRDELMKIYKDEVVDAIVKEDTSVFNPGIFNAVLNDFSLSQRKDVKEKITSEVRKLMKSSSVSLDLSEKIISLVKKIDIELDVSLLKQKVEKSKEELRKTTVSSILQYLGALQGLLSSDLMLISKIHTAVKRLTDYMDSYGLRMDLCSEMQSMYAGLHEKIVAHFTCVSYEKSNLALYLDSAKLMQASWGDKNQVISAIFSKKDFELPFEKARYKKFVTDAKALAAHSLLDNLDLFKRVLNSFPWASSSPHTPLVLYKKFCEFVLQLKQSMPNGKFSPKQLEMIRYFKKSRVELGYYGHKSNLIDNYKRRVNNGRQVILDIEELIVFAKLAHQDPTHVLQKILKAVDLKQDMQFKILLDLIRKYPILISPAVFEKIIEKIPFENASNMIDARVFQDKIKQLQEVMPGKKFTEAQARIIEVRGEGIKLESGHVASKGILRVEQSSNAIKKDAFFKKKPSAESLAKEIPQKRIG